MSLVILSRPKVLPWSVKCQIAKRVMDVALCLLILPVVLPIMLICTLAIYLDSWGPAILAQERVGKGGRRFRMYKFRTMQHDIDNSYHQAFMKAFVHGKIGNGGNPDNRQAFLMAFVSNRKDYLMDLESLDEQMDQAPASTMSNGPGTRIRNNTKRPKIYKPAHAAQITLVGRILRKTSLDELPQIINVLKGDMSLVGPRPNIPCEVEEYQPWHYERLEVLPGVTGLAQARGRSGISFDRIVAYDIEYIQKQSLAMDIKILWWTLESVLCGKGAG